MGFIYSFIAVYNCKTHIHIDVQIMEVLLCHLLQLVYLYIATIGSSVTKSSNEVQCDAFAAGLLALVKDILGSFHVKSTRKFGSLLGF